MTGPGRDETDPAVRSLVEEFKISPEQAIRQLWNQLFAGRAELELPSQLRGGYAGRAIDHASDGTVTLFVVSSSDMADQVIEHFESFGIDPLAIRRVDQSDDSMVSIASSLARSLRDLDWEDETYDVRRSAVDRIEISVERDARLPSEFTSLVGKYHSALVRVVEVDEVRQGVDEACDWTGDIECDPPLRGSVRINQDVPGGNPVCTAGYNVRSLSDDVPYVLFPGHCTEGATYDPAVAWETQFEDHSVHLIGVTHNAQDNSNHDAGILRVNNPTGWQFGQAIVTVDPTWPHSANEFYPVYDVQNAGFGDRTCSTLGNSARTDCGTVTTTYVTGGDTDGLIEATNLCSDGGDSGSPYFSFGIDYAIHISGDGNSVPDPCYYGRGQPALEAASVMNVYILEQ